MDFTLISNQLSDFQRAFLLRFYRSQFWRLQKLYQLFYFYNSSFIGHNFGDYKNHSILIAGWKKVLSVTILETTKTAHLREIETSLFYRSQFWRLQKPS